jgi:hypothetical protein
MQGRATESAVSAPEFAACSRDGRVLDLTPEDGRIRAEAKEPDGLPMSVEQSVGGRAGGPTNSTRLAGTGLKQCGDSWYKERCRTVFTFPINLYLVFP